MKFFSKHELQCHQKTSHFEVKRFSCEFCSQSYIKNDMLRDHILSVHEKEQLHKCNLCEKTSYSERSIRVHSRVAHGKEVNCKICGKFLHRMRINHHIQNIHGVSQTKKSQNYKCDICGQSFKTNFLKEHKMRVHEKFKPFSCEKCEKLFLLKSELESHIKNVHLKIKL